jgi:DNA-binding transcriptional regulator GbsR (MarR family)
MDGPTAHFIETMGLALESEGLPRIAGRIFGLLLVSAEARSLDELAAELQVSKASISTNARLLEHRGVLEQVSRPADRRDYYQIPHDLFSHTMAQRLAAGSNSMRPSVPPEPAFPSGARRSGNGSRSSSRPMPTCHG